MNSIGVDFKLKNITVKNKKVKLQIWDTAGQERFRTITTSYYKGAQAIIVVYDITDRDSFDHVKNWMADCDKFAKEGVLRILAGNKFDLNNIRKVGKDEAEELSKKYGIQYIEVSAKDNSNVEELFINTTEIFLGRNAGVSNKGVVKESKGIDLNKEDEEKKKRMVLLSYFYLFYINRYFCFIFIFKFLLVYRFV
jgi:Ras-related protein Rab-1A